MYIYPLKPEEIYHFGTKEHSGRYPWGSGDRPYQSEKRSLPTTSDPETDFKKSSKLKSVGKIVGKSMLKLAITSAKAAIFAAAGSAFITSEVGGEILDAVIFKSGTFLLGSFARGGVSELYQIGQDFIDELLG